MSRNNLKKDYILIDNLQKILNGETFDFSFDEVQEILRHLLNSDIQNFDTTEKQHLDDFLSSVLSTNNATNAESIDSNLIIPVQNLLQNIRGLN